MSDLNLVNKIYQIIRFARHELFNQGELAQLTYLAYEDVVKKIQDNSREEIEINYPVGYRPDKQAISGSRKYKKQELIDRYAYLGNHQLAINGIYQLVTIMESMFGDILRNVILKFPNKIGARRSVKTSMILAASSIEEIHLQAIDTLLNELAYKSPREFVEECNQLLSVNLLECPAYHKYIEVKATRDIYIHNQGIANDIYLTKAQSHARVKADLLLPIDTVYFLESYESCIQITEWLEKSLHDVWHSSEYETYKSKGLKGVQQQNPADS
jgi:hypothetical protein